MSDFLQRLVSFSGEVIRDFVRVAVFLNPAVVMPAGDNNGQDAPAAWSAAIIVVNNTGNLLKIGDAGFVFASGQRMTAVTGVARIELPVLITNRKRAAFKLQPDTISGIAQHAADRISYVYATGVNGKEYKGRLSRATRDRLDQIVSLIQRPD
ncbi:MAG: hypothetical protein PHU08_02590 [Dehalococcoidales bacterium]|nr:hypothetical protein [Dehalococcoidales bacterium]